VSTPSCRARSGRPGCWTAGAAVASVKAVLRGGTDWAKVVEALLLLLHLAGYVTALVLVLSPLQAVVFIVVQQGLFGLYLGCSFAPNHKGMPTLSYADQLDFVRRQVEP
jgi:hypothetical protein